MDSEGLVILTDDGGLIHRLTEPRHRVDKTYLVQVEGEISPEAVAELQRGVMVKGRRTKRCRAVVIPEPELPQREQPVAAHRVTSWLRLVLNEGKKRQIRHMTAKVGYPTLRLVRIAIGGVNLEGLQPGQWRELEAEEIQKLI